MTPHPASEDLMAWLDAELDPSSSTRVAAHVAGCDVCRRLTDDLGAIRVEAGRWRVDAAPPGVGRAVSAAVSTLGRPAGSPAADRPTSGWRQYRWPALAAAAAAVVVLVGTEVSLCGAALCRVRNVQEDRRATSTASDLTALSSFDAWWEAVPRVDLHVQASAAVVVVWFVDYECPACAASDAIYTNAIDAYVAAHPGDVTLVVKDWPWNSECNATVQATFRGHEASCAAAAAVRMAEPLGTASTMRQWLFTHQGGTTVEDVRDAAREVGGIRDFDERLPDEIRAIRADTERLSGASINSTPSCFVNGKLASEGGGRLLSTANLGRAIEIALKKGR